MRPLSQGTVSPQSGPAGSNFQLSVVYMDPDGDPPAYAQARVIAPDQSVSTYTMVPQPSQSSGDYSTGVAYEVTLGASAHPIPGTYMVRLGIT